MPCPRQGSGSPGERPVDHQSLNRMNYQTSGSRFGPTATSCHISPTVSSSLTSSQLLGGTGPCRTSCGTNLLFLYRCPERTGVASRRPAFVPNVHRPRRPRSKTALSPSRSEDHGSSLHSELHIVGSKGTLLPSFVLRPDQKPDGPGRWGRRNATAWWWRWERVRPRTRVTGCHRAFRRLDLRLAT